MKTLLITTILLLSAITAQAKLSLGTCQAMQGAAEATLAARYLGIPKGEVRALLNKAIGPRPSYEVVYMVFQVFDNAYKKDVSTSYKRISAEIQMAKDIREFCN